LGGQLLKHYNANTMLEGLSDEDKVLGTQVGRYVAAAATAEADNEVSNLD
jgi:hypothetical protein